MEYHLVALPFVLLIMLSVNVTATKEILSTPAICEPGVLEEMPQHIRRVCIALENSNQLSTTLNEYIRSQALSLLTRPEDLTNPNSPAGKRTDVDHVFLRFGRRR